MFDKQPPDDGLSVICQYAVLKTCQSLHYITGICRFPPEPATREKKGGYMRKAIVCPGNPKSFRNIAAGSAGSIMILFAALLIVAVPAWAGAQIQTERVSVGSAGEQTSNSSSHAALPQAVSADGRYVLFESHCNLGELDYFAYGYVYLRDRSTGETTPVNLKANGMPFICASPALSDNGRYVVFISNHNYFPDYFVDDQGTVITGGGIFRLDLETGRVIRVDLDNDGNPAVGYWESPRHSVYAGPSYPAVSADGRYVAFRSWATNLAEGQNPEVADIFLRETHELTTQLVTFGIDGPAGHIIYNNGGYYDCHSAPAISADGRYVAFHSMADDLVASDSNGEEEDVFVYDRNAGPGNKITLVSVHSDGTQGRQPVRYEALPIPAVSAEGHVVFESRAENLVNGDNNDYVDVFVHDISTGETMLASRANTGGSCNGGARRPDISADGRYVVFESSANDLVPGDNNGLPGQSKGIDVFRFDRTTGEMTLMSRAGDGTQGNNGSARRYERSIRCLYFLVRNPVHPDGHPGRDRFGYGHQRSGGDRLRRGLF